MISDLAQAIPVPKQIADGSTSRRNLHLRSKDGDNVERSTHSYFAVYAFTVAILRSEAPLRWYETDSHVLSTGDLNAFPRCV
jgi:hypothetical protein